jgi:hypothetical protein
MTQTSPAAPILTFPTKAARVEWMRQQLKTNTKWALHALVTIANQQTTEEQISDRTIQHNGVGFGANDGDILMSFAKQVIAWNAETVHKYATPLSARQVELLKKRIGKYARQLCDLSQAKLDQRYPIVKQPKAPKADPAQAGATTSQVAG